MSSQSLRYHRTMDRPLTSIFLLLLMVVILGSLSTLVEAQLMTCPQVCSCIWRNGKQTTICENQNLISIPNQISPSTQVLDLNTNNFQILPSKAFQERGLINLQKLFLPRCKLGAIAEDAFVQLTNLVELDLSDNLLTQIPVRALANSTNLRRLLLNNNHIATINAESFASLNNLKFLNLSGCQTHTIEPRAFFGLHDLEYLYLNSNHLTTLPYTVVTDLPALYSFDLYRNPWHCNCEMRATREWMIRNNVGQSLPPTCELPVRLSGLMWNSLDLDDFACEPDIITTTVEVAKTVGSNATLSCVVKGLPEPKVFWYVDDGFYRNLSSSVIRGEKYHLTEERGEGTVHSMLTIIGLDPTDASNSFICSGENRAGMKSKNFTVFVLPSSGFGSVTANWSKVELAGGVVGILISLVLTFVLITLILIRTKKLGVNRQKFPGSGQNGPGDGDSIDKKKPTHLTLLKNGSLFSSNSTTMLTPPYANHHNYNQTPTIDSIQQHLSMLGLDGIDKKPEIFLSYSNNPQQQQQMQNYTGSMVPPDLVPSGSNLVLQSNGGQIHQMSSGYDLNAYNNELAYSQMMQQQQQANYDMDDVILVQQQQSQQPGNEQLGNDNYEIYGQHPAHALYHQQQQQQQQSAVNYQTQPEPGSDGLYRAVMVPSVMSNHPGSHRQGGGGQSSPPFSLSAANLYSQYLSQSNYELNNFQRGALGPEQQQQQSQQSNRISPDSFSALALANNRQHNHNQHSNLHTPLHHQPQHHNQSSPYQHHNAQHQESNHRTQHGPNNPSSQDLLMMYDDEVFHPNHHQQQQQFQQYNADNAAIYGAMEPMMAPPPIPTQPNIQYHQHQNQHQQNQHQQSQPIYGQSSKGKLLGHNWSNSTGALHLALQNPVGVMGATNLATATPAQMVRYSPDEGYAEESPGSSSAHNGSGPILVVGQLQGTEV